MRRPHVIPMRVVGPSLAVAGTAIFALSGCGGDGTSTDVTSPATISPTSADQVFDVSAEIAGSSLNASWQPPEDIERVLEYRVFALDSEQAPAGQCNAIPPQTSCTIVDLAAGTYTVAIRVVTTDGLGPLSQPSEPVELSAS